ncbi:Uncharacterised protein [Mycobacteroides abscessus subsp. massiliense]|nr:Uncharacterised protein [Mycobacteroides abscessus]SKF51067.1 Uncharacterised protein [Mycobacteroides abscessus subsp. massiliense]CPX88592.1 Uncharacterised protein [Mycobacteroides abscessus]CPZ27673.1 Uncharacterised protein [Mycobacteroides abscessus]CPZ28369.1 Uncharacterised protein [Mycobacteroides abscessus]
MLRRFGDRAIQPVGLPVAGVDDLPTEFDVFHRNDQLLRYAVDRRKHRAEALMTIQHIREGSFQRVGIQDSLQTQSHR